MATDNNSLVTNKKLEEVKNELISKLASKAELKKLATKNELKKLATKEELKKLATKEEIKKLATKEEIKKLATKEELKKLATKEEIKKLATKEEIKKLATKEELKIEMGKVWRAHDALAIQVARNTVAIENLSAELREKFDLVLEALDHIRARFDRYETERISSERTFMRHEQQLENHEKRITTLETKI